MTLFGDWLRSGVWSKAVSAVRQMQPDRRSGRIWILPANRIEDGLVLEVGQVGMPRQVRPCPLGKVDSASGNHRAAEESHHLGEVGITRCFCDEKVKPPVGLDTAIAGRRQILVVVQGLPHSRQMLVAAPQCSQGSGLPLNADPQLQHLPNTGSRLHGQVQAVGRLPLDDEGANSVPGLDKARCLQLGKRLAYQGAAHPMLTSEAALGWELVSGLECPEENLLGEVGNQVVSPAMGSLARLAGRDC